MAEFKPDFILDDKVILWKLHESALKKNSDIADLTKQFKFINTAISKNVEKSFSISTNIYELIICDSIKKSEIVDISLLSKDIINLNKRDLARETKILQKQEDAFNLFKKYLICFCNKIYADKIQIDDIIFDVIPLDFKKKTIQNGMLKPIKYSDYSSDEQLKDEISFAFHIVYSIGLKV